MNQIFKISDAITVLERGCPHNTADVCRLCANDIALYLRKLYDSLNTVKAQIAVELVDRP